MICNFMIFSESVGSGARLSAKNDILGGTWNVIFISRKYTEVGGKMLPL